MTAAKKRIGRIIVMREVPPGETEKRALPGYGQFGPIPQWSRFPDGVNLERAAMQTSSKHKTEHESVLDKPQAEHLTPENLR